MIPVYTDFQIPYTCNGEERGIEGEVRAINGELKVFNGSMWENVNTTAYVDDFVLEEVLEWARQKMAQEAVEKRLAEQFPAFAKAKENYELIRRLTIDELA